ncbi:MAG: type II toxin-antitoxin system YafQ family toxin [Clostridia bacterium]
MLKVRYQNAFKKDFKLIKKRGYDIKKLENIINLLSQNQPLPESNKDHALIGNYKGCRECHIEPDWLLVYEVNDQELVLYLLRTGSHSDLF